jgi:hypothetical protein
MGYYCLVAWDATDGMEIDLLDPSYLSDHYVAKILSWLVNLYTGLTKVDSHGEVGVGIGN